MSNVTTEGCTCLQQINEALAKDEKQNTVVGNSLILNFKTGRERVVVEIATYKRDSRSRVKKRGMIPTFCPFCGKRYPDGADDE